MPTLDDLDSALGKVSAFKAVTARGKQRPLLSKQGHIKLIKEKATDATNMNEHITLFRVQDKRGLPQREKEHHTVSGPNWTPCASAGFVIGASTVDHRIYLATETSLSARGLLGKKGEPSIYAREISTAFSLGYSSRNPKPHEKYEKSQKAPRIVLSPPPSPGPFPKDDLETIFDVKAGWNDLPIQPAMIQRLTIPKEDRFKKHLEDEGFEMDDLEESLIEIALDKKIFPLIEKGILELSEMMDMDEETLKEILENKEVYMVISSEEIEFANVLEMYSEYGDYSIEEVDIQDLYALSIRHEKALKAMLDDLGLELPQIISAFNEYEDDISIFADLNVIAFLSKFSDEINYEKLLEINAENPELFGAMVTDPSNVIQDKGMETFIDKFTTFQEEIEAAEREGFHIFGDSAYDRVASWALYDGCPDECWPRDEEEDDEAEYGGYEYDDYGSLSDYSDDEEGSVVWYDDSESESDGEPSESDVEEMVNQMVMDEVRESLGLGYSDSDSSDSDSDESSLSGESSDDMDYDGL